MQEHNYSIKTWAKDDQPREKLLLNGVENLSNSELISILIQNGTAKKTAVDLAKEVLRSAKNNLNELGKLSIRDLTKIKGIGKVKAMTILAAIELGKRRLTTGIIEKNKINSSREIASYLQTSFKDYNYEVFAVLYLNQANKINHFEVLSTGGITSTVVDPRIVIRRALEEEAVNIILCHNHPSGSLRPSRADLDITKKIKDAAILFDIRLLDHLIVSEEGYLSFADEGLI